MSLVHKPWPLGLARHTAPLYLGLFGALIGVLYFADHAISGFGTSLPPELRETFRFLTGFGESDWILVPSLLVFAMAGALHRFTRDRLRAAFGELAALSGFIFAGVGLPGLAATLLKRLIGRGRPETFTDQSPLAFHPNWSMFEYQSFPSGHATTAFAVAMVVAFIWPRTLSAALVFAGLVAFSRVVVGAHYPTDITAGAVLGVLGAYFVRNLFASRGWLFTRLPEGTHPRKPFVALPALLRPQAK